MPKTKKLKLVARDDKDLTVISSLLQDAVLTPDEMGYYPAAQQFLMVAARIICKQKSAQRQKTGIHIAGVTASKHHGIDGLDKKQPLMLLTMRLADDAIDLVFSGDVRVKLTTPSIEVYAVDLDEESWPTAFTPSHKAAFTHGDR